MQTFEAFLKFVERIVSWVLAAMVVVIFLMIASLLVDRYIVRVPIMAPDEISKIAIVWMTFLGFGLALNDRTNIRVDLVDQMLAPKYLNWLEIAFDGAILVMTTVIVSKCWILVEIGKGQAILGTPFNAALTNLSLLVGGALMLLFTFARLLRRIRGSRQAQN
jgi:TRAP-type C4-dicarboxylate transport system permease small subunit